MDTGTLLAWAVGFLTASGLLRLLKVRGPGRRGWIAVHVVVLAVLSASLLVRPAWAGPASGGVWALLILAPLLLGVAARRLVAQRRYGPARAMAAVAAVLHPADGWLGDPALIRDLGRLDRGDAEAARAVLDRARTSKSPLAQSAPAVLFQKSGDWEGLKAWAESARGADGLLAEPVAAVLYVRALGEIGEIDAMARAYALHEGRFTSVQGRDLARLFLFGYGGRPDAVRRLFEGSLRDYPPQTQDYFLGTAEIAAGDVDRGRARLEALTADPQRAAAERRLSAPPPAPAGPWTRALMEEVDRHAGEELRYDPLGRGPGRPLATWALLALLGAGFLVSSIAGGTTDPEALIDAGAVWVLPGRAFEPWRLASSLFLHFGALHLAMNGIALLLFGPFVERALGRLRFFLVYFGSGLIGSMAAVGLVRRLHPEQAFFLVGASGCIFGLIGATAAHLLAGWRRDRAETARRRLGMIGVMVATQAAFDFTVLGGGSFMAHTGGLVGGFLLAVVLGPSPNLRKA